MNDFRLIESAKMISTCLTLLSVVVLLILLFLPLVAEGHTELCRRCGGTLVAVYESRGVNGFQQFRDWYYWCPKCDRKFRGGTDNGYNSGEMNIIEEHQKRMYSVKKSKKGRSWRDIRFPI